MQARPDPAAMTKHASPNPENGKTNNNGSISSGVVARRERPPRVCAQRAAAARRQAAAEADAATNRKRMKPERREEPEEEDEPSRMQCGRIITPLLGEPEDSELPRRNIRSMWQLASILNFLNVFRPLLNNIEVEFSAEDLETALLTPNNTLADIHIPLLRAIPPVTKKALGRPAWIAALCRKLRVWWYWVAEGDLPIVASHGTEVEAYIALDPEVRVVILKALCDIRVQQADIRNYIDESIKHGVQFSAFCKKRLGGDSYGVSYWYEDDPIIGHRMYREIRKVEVKKGKGRNIPPIPHSSYQWEAVATNLDEFQNVSEKLFSSSNRTEVSVGNKLKNDMLPEIEKVRKRKEKQSRKQHIQSFMLDNMMHMDGLIAGRSLHDRKRITYTSDDYDRSINEVLKATKDKKPSPHPYDVKRKVYTNGGWGGPSYYSQSTSFRTVSPKWTDDDELYDDQKTETLDRRNRLRQRPQRYSVAEYVEAVSDNEVNFFSDDDIVGEVVYNDDYLKKRKQTSASKADEEYQCDQHNPEEEENILSTGDDSDDNSNVPHIFKIQKLPNILSTGDDSHDDSIVPRFKIQKLPSRARREETTPSSSNNLQSGLRRSQRATRNHIDYRLLETLSESDNELTKHEKPKNVALDSHLDLSDYEVEMSKVEEHHHHTESMDEKQSADEEEEFEGGRKDGFSI